MRLLSECFPLLIGIGPMRYDAEAVARMAEAFDPFHQRGERYAFGRPRSQRAEADHGLGRVAERANTRRPAVRRLGRRRG